MPKNTKIVVAGLSGGGWTSTVLSAIEPKFALTVAVAGSFPFALRSETESNVGDWEQWLPGLFPDYGYLDLYLLGTTPSRKVINIHNSKDSCCFATVGSDLSWVSYLKLDSRRMGGKFDFVVENQTIHDLGPKGLEILLLAMKEI